jgi:hypothetical protein
MIRRDEDGGADLDLLPRVIVHGDGESAAADDGGLLEDGDVEREGRCGGELAEMVGCR